MRSLIASLVVASALAASVPASADAPPFGPHVIYGVIKQVAHATLVVQLQTRKLETVDIGPARANGRTGVLYVGRGVALYGDFDRSHRYHVNSIMSAYGVRQGVWPQSR